MAKEILFSEDKEYAFGLVSEFDSQADFVAAVKDEYEESPITLTDIEIQSYIFADDVFRGNEVDTARRS